MTTIFALGTGAGRAAIAVLRLSGPGVVAILEQMAGAVPPPRRASLRALRAVDGEVLDRGIVLFWPEPGSYTGEDCAELHLHGGQAVLDAVCQALVATGARPAEPGEFTRRAFLNGKMDLLEAEGVADLVAAETEAQRRMAMRQIEGEQSGIVTAWAERLRRVLAWQEALIDFPDEDLPQSVERELLCEVEDLGLQMQAACRDAERGLRVRRGLVIAVTGAPNVGKSSLVNALAQRDAAITSPLPGTTRDALEVWTQIGGVGVTLIDTAGLRETSDPVEAEGVRRAVARAASADIVMRVIEARGGEVACVDKRVLCVANKIDVTAAPVGWIGVSALTGAGLATLRQALADAVLRLTRAEAGAPLSRVRHVAALTEAASCLTRARLCALPEIRGEELRLAMRALGLISGHVGVEDVLDTIFGAFCIGK